MASASSTAPAPALSLSWALGLNKDVPNGVHSLDGSDVFYTAAHTGVIYDYNTGVQKLLQGHVNPISAATVSGDKTLIVTADSGADSMLVIWERATGAPAKILFSPYKNGVQAIDMSPDQKYLATLSAPEGTGTTGEDGQEEMRQYLSIWDWRNSSLEGPLCTAVVGAQDVQTAVAFNKWDTSEVATNGRRRVFFWSWDAAEAQPFSFYSPALQAKDFKQKLGAFTQTIFLPDSTQAATGTSDGDVVVWDLSLVADGLARPDERRAVKILRLSQNAGLEVLQVQGPHVVVGSADGNVRFYDFQFRLKAWFEDLSAGAVKSISFDSDGGAGDAGGKFSSSTGARSGEEEPFRCPNFLVATGSALVVACHADLFGRLEAAQRRGRLVLQGLDSPAHGLAAHPNEALLAVSGLSGFLHLWNYESRTLQAVKVFEKLAPVVLSYSQKGARCSACAGGPLLAVGFTTGQVKILNPQLQEVAQFRDSRDAVLFLEFSPCGGWLAAGFADRTVCIYHFGQPAEKKNVDWHFAGRQREHARPLVGLTWARGAGWDETPASFLNSGAAATCRLFTLAEDRKLIEYAVNEVSDGKLNVDFLVQSATSVDQEAVPTGLCWLPSAAMGAAGAAGSDAAAPLASRLLTSSNEYKFKTYVDGRCRGTALCPTYGGPLTKLTPLDENGDYFLYATSDKVVGLLQTPLDGNPNRYMGLIGHPGPVAALAVDHERRFLFTAGGPDLTVNMWNVDTQPVATAALAGGQGVNAFAKLIDGGADGAFLTDMRDYFYYAQLRAQGEMSTKPRALDGTIPVSEIPALMCALGYFPTQLECANMAAEIRELQGKDDKIDFEAFVRLYVNHRPVFPVEQEDVERALLQLANATQGPAGELASQRKIGKNALLSLLTSQGGAVEKLSSEELEKCLALLGGSDSVLAGDAVDVREFAGDVLGFAPGEGA